MTRIEVLALVQENGVVGSLVDSMGMQKLEPSMPSALAVNGARAAIVRIIEDTLVDLIMGAQTETAETAWKIVVDEEVPNRVRERLGPKFRAAFPGVTLP